MTTLVAVPTETLPPVADSHPFEVWEQEGQDLFLRLQRTEAAHELSQWEIGDWLHKGVKEKPRAEQGRAYDAAERITGWSRATLHNIVSVVGRFPTDSLRSETTLKWSHFKELARIPDETKRFKLLDEFSDGLPHSVEDVRTRVNTIVRQEENQDKGKKDKNKPLVIRLFLKQDDWNHLRNLADAEGKEPEDYLTGIVKDHLKKREITSQLRNISATAKRTGAK
jgi:hypothetical protein